MKAKRRAMGVLVAAGLLACCASGCLYKPVQIGGPMFGNEALKGKRLVRLGEGEACSSNILYVIPAGDSSMEAALERLVQATGSKTGWTPDVVTVEEGRVFWLLGLSSCTRLVGYGAKQPATKFKTTAILSGETDQRPGAVASTGEAPAADSPAAEPVTGERAEDE